MKRILLVFVLFGSVAHGMDRLYSTALVEQEQERQNIAQTKGQEVLQLLQVLVYHREQVTPEDMHTIQAILNEGADVNVTTVLKKTPLHLAVQLANIDLVQLLLEHGAQVNAKDYVNETPLFGASDFMNDFNNENERIEVAKRIELAKLLIEHGADVNFPTDSGQTPLIRAVITRNVPLVELLAHGTFKVKGMQELGAQDTTYFSLLPTELRAMAFKHLKIKADLYRKEYGKTVLEIAKSRLEHVRIDPEFFRKINRAEYIKAYERIIAILEPLTVSGVASQSQPQPQPQKSWWQRWMGR
jgi:hypothetical protein